jgi:hypothetical protein
MEVVMTQKEYKKENLLSKEAYVLLDNMPLNEYMPLSAIPDNIFYEVWELIEKSKRIFKKKDIYLDEFGNFIILPKNGKLERC